MRSYYAPCKINLNLRVLGKREDGFHEVDTLMAPVGLYDKLHFSKSKKTNLICDNALLPLDDENLVMKAVRLFERETGRTVNYTIDLVKRIPHGAGLGGGSSDAATTLVALNELERTDLTNQQLVEMAAELGSDVAFFIYGQICRCTGRGEIVTPLPELAGFRATILLLKPGFSVSTPDAYSRWEGSRELHNVPYGPQPYRDLELVNDLERPVFEKYLFLPEIKKWLLSQRGIDAAMMSGSGSTMFAIFRSELTAMRVAKRAVKTLDSSMWTWVGTCGV